MKGNLMKIMTALLSVSLLVAMAGYASAADAPAEAHLTLSNHAFEPQVLTIPAGKKIKLIVTNKDDAAAEFESDELGREKVVPANGEIFVYVGPLDPGTYGFYDDFHRKTTTGSLIAK
jgi:plastocyanin